MSCNFISSFNAAVQTYNDIIAQLLQLCQTLSCGCSGVITVKYLSNIYTFVYADRSVTAVVAITAASTPWSVAGEVLEDKFSLDGSFLQTAVICSTSSMHGLLK